MAECEQAEQAEVPEYVSDEEEPNYKPPPQKSIKEITELDAEDESLRKYKETLLGKSATQAGSGDGKPVVKVQKIILMPTDHEDICIDIPADPSTSKEHPSYIMKEGVKYKIKFIFTVQNEIISGLKYVHNVYRGGIRVAADKKMLGTFAPKEEVQDTTTKEEEEAPHGFLARGTYTIKSRFVSDDEPKLFEFQWILKIKKDWD